MRRHRVFKTGNLSAGRFETTSLSLRGAVRPRAIASLRKRRQDIFERVQSSTGSLSLEITAQKNLQQRMQLR